MMVCSPCYLYRMVHLTAVVLEGDDVSGNLTTCIRKNFEQFNAGKSPSQLARVQTIQPQASNIHLWVSLYKSGYH